ncbi:MAG: hypothetical protein ACLGGO_20010 [Coleofasciculus sp.]
MRNLKWVLLILQLFEAATIRRLSVAAITFQSLSQTVSLTILKVNGTKNCRFGSPKPLIYRRVGIAHQNTRNVPFYLKYCRRINSMTDHHQAASDNSPLNQPVAAAPLQKTPLAGDINSMTTVT